MKPTWSTGKAVLVASALGAVLAGGTACVGARAGRLPGRWAGSGYDPAVEIDVALAAKARSTLQDEPDFREWDEDPLPDREAPREGDRPGAGSIFLGELVAIFPGLFVPGLGHYYAGDYRTSEQLRRVGGLGIALTLVGGGVVTGGYFLDQEDISDGYAYGAYAAGGTVGTIGLGYFLTGWIYDIVDTPRAVRTGGRPPPRSNFVESLDIFSR